jgi:hypothetical protein
MTLDEFLNEFEIKFKIEQSGRELTVLTEVFRKSNSERVRGGAVKSTFDIFETNDFISDSKFATSLSEWNWDKVIEEAKRVQLDHFAMIVPIEDFFPRNINTDISEIYSK